MTVRERLSASEHAFTGLLYEHASTTLFQAARHPITIVDPIGATDSFAAGLIHALVTGRSADRALSFAVAAGALKHSIPGDYNRVSVAEVDQLVASAPMGRGTSSSRKPSGG
jgi:2-dehydro-3-deoxygluconokinase